MDRLEIRIWDESDVELLELLPFNKAQAKEFLRRRLENTDTKSRTLERVQAVIDAERHTDVFGSPFFLAELVGLLGERKFSISGFRDLGTLGYFVSSAFERERRRQEHQFSDLEQQRFLEAIALDMLRTGVASYSLEDLRIFLAEAVPEDIDDSEALGLINNHFLDKLDGPRGGVASIKHQIWREYFQGNALAKLYNTNQPLWTRVVDARPLPEGVIRTFVRILRGMPTANVASLSGASDIRVRNLLNMWMMRDARDTGVVKESLPAHLVGAIHGRNMSELTFESVDFSGASFHNCNLTGTYFTDCDLRGVSWAGALLSSTTFKACLFDDGVGDANSASVIVDDLEYFGREFQSVWQGAQAVGPSVDIRAYAVGVLRERMSKFIKPSGFDSAIGWRAFLGGARPGDREFITRVLYRALRSEGFLSPARAGSGSRPPVVLAADQAQRREVQELVSSGAVGPLLTQVIDRVEKRTH